MYGQGNGAPTAKRPARKITVPEIRARKGGPPLAMVTAYDFTMARLFDEGGADLLLVGDSLGMVVQGHPTTLPVTVEEICYHSRAVARGARHAHVVADMPFMSFQVSPEKALENAGKLVKDGACESVKLEGGEEVAEHVRRIVLAGIPVMGHVGLTPQSINTLGSFRARGRDEADSAMILEDAKAVSEAGAFSIVVEAVAEPLGRKITESVASPTIGIGASVACDGQVLVLEDMLGLSPWAPKFVKRYGDLGPGIEKAIQDYASEVRSRAFPGPEHVYNLKPKTAK